MYEAQFGRLPEAGTGESVAPSQNTRNRVGGTNAAVGRQ